MEGFNYICPKSKQEALMMLAELGKKARIVAGCTNILPNIQAKKLTAGVLIDISRLDELKSIEAKEIVFLGSLVTVAQIAESSSIKQAGGVLWQASQQFADPLVRNRATIGGNLANASPAADGAVPLLALNAEVVIESTRGTRNVSLPEFFVGPGMTTLADDELITGIAFPNASNWQGAFIKFGLRRSMAVSLASIGVVVDLDGRRIKDARIALGALAPTPMRALQTEHFLKQKDVDGDVIEKAAEIISAEVQPISDVRATKEYRSYLAGVLFKRALEKIIG